MFNVVCGLYESFILFVPLHIIRLNVMCVCMCVYGAVTVCVVLALIYDYSKIFCNYLHFPYKCHPIKVLPTFFIGIR